MQKVAVLHYWWLSNRGGEAVVTEILKIYPHADLYIHVCDEELVKKNLAPFFRGKIYSTFISKLPFAKKLYQKYIALMPFALEQLDLSKYDLVISSESGPVKGVITRPDAIHICYCHSPMRYIWDMYPEYLSRSGFFVRNIFPLIAHYLRAYDRLSADRVDFFIANSNFVSSRIGKFYRRKSVVINPPVFVEKFDPNVPRENFYLYLGQLVSYKRVDIAIDAFNTLGLPLVVIGEGEEYQSLSKFSKNNITFMGRQPFAVVKEYLERCKGLIFPGIEDFGIVPIEAMAAGAPVIAYAKGGAVESVIDLQTGILFYEQTSEALIEAIERFEKMPALFNPQLLHNYAKIFDVEVFHTKFKQFIDKIETQIFPGDLT
jgi:glycosyltransferase involved in cell wall biosynthesis